MSGPSSVRFGIRRACRSRHRREKIEPGARKNGDSLADVPGGNFFRHEAREIVLVRYSRT